MSTQLLEAVAPARDARSVSQVLDPARAQAASAASALQAARKESGFHRVLDQEAAAASRAAAARERIARRQNSVADPEGARFVHQAVQSLLKRAGNGTATPSATPAKTTAAQQIESLKAALQQLWLQGEGSRAGADLAALAAAAGAPSASVASQAATATGAPTDASKSTTLTGLDWKPGLDALLASLKQTAASTNPTTDATGTDAQAASPEQVASLAAAVMDAVQANANGQSVQASQPAPLPDMIYLTQSPAGGDSAASDADSPGGMRLVGLANGKDDVVSSMQTVLDRLQADASPAAQRRTTASAPGDAPTVGQVQVNGSTLGAHASSDALAADAARAAAAAQTAHLTDSVRQVQAAMSDMLDRMRGNVALDTDRMRAVIQLDPPSLGRVHVALSVDDAQRVHATFHAEDASTRDFLQQNQSDLRREFERQGYTPSNVEISFDDEPEPASSGAGSNTSRALGAMLASSASAA